MLTQTQGKQILPCLCSHTLCARLFHHSQAEKDAHKKKCLDGMSKGAEGGDSEGDSDDGPESEEEEDDYSGASRYEWGGTTIFAAS